MARQKVLGVPIGKKRRSSSGLARTAGSAAAVLVPAVAVPAARRIGTLGRKAGDVVEKGQGLAGKASDAANLASDVKESVSSHSSTIGKAFGLVSALARAGKGGGGSKPKLSHLIEQHTDIAVPRSVVYNQWTQLEMWPTIVKGVEQVEQVRDDRARWTAKIGPSRRSWTGRIVEQVPDERIAWKSEGGVALHGVVTFHSLDQELTRVLLQMEYKPGGPVEWVGNTLRIQRRRAKRDLRLFKHFVELRGEETGAWRGRIEGREKLEPTLAGQSSNGSGTPRTRSRSHSVGGRQSRQPARSRA